MSAELIASLASQGITTKEAAKRAGLPYYQFVNLRSLYPEIKWGITPAQRKGLSAGRSVLHLPPETVEAIQKDDRTIREICAAFNISRATAYKHRRNRRA